MIDHPKDGGPAFPSEFLATEHGDHVHAFDGTPGMLLRDWFAGQALIGLIGSTGEPAKTAYIIADAMLKERSK